MRFSDHRTSTTQSGTLRSFRRRISALFPLRQRKKLPPDFRAEVPKYQNGYPRRKRMDRSLTEREKADFRLFFGAYGNGATEQFAVR